jgi:hypothetical protein
MRTSHAPWTGSTAKKGWEGVGAVGIGGGRTAAKSFSNAYVFS